jgi:alpha-mannosidase
MNIENFKLKEIKKQNPAGYWVKDEIIRNKDILFSGTLLGSQSQSWYWSNRIISQIEYAIELNKIFNTNYNNILNSAIDFLYENYRKEKSITKTVALETEKLLLPLSQIAKSFKILCVAHAHIDMNWMWRYDETVSVVLETFRTVLKLMSEYPKFKFSQSQASVYKILEEFDLEMLEEVKKRIKEGKWEVTASTWVEHDKNMPNSESMVRQILYAKQYLSRILEIDSESLQIDFEPDTFGHSINIPELLFNAGIKYYYHCRGYKGYNIYKWLAPSGNYVIAYNEPFWYNSPIDSSVAINVPQFCTKYNIDTMLKVYGIGDHGGGPTRRDIERIIDMNDWPVFPEFRFGTYHEYFSLLDKNSSNLHEVKKELNFVFTGCYTSQSKLKQANRISEKTLNEAEMFSTFSCLLTSSLKYPSLDFSKAWENVLFNQFHDILPGSCTGGSREYAMGLFQKTMAITNTHLSYALRHITGKIDTYGIFQQNEKVNKESISEGAGVGYGVENFKVIQSEQNNGKERIFHVFNSATFVRREVVEITIWDWDGDLEKIIIKNEKGKIITHQLIDRTFQSYWGHNYFRLLINAEVTSCGYSTYIMGEMEENDLEFSKEEMFNVFTSGIEKPDEFIMENEYIKVTFDSKNLSINSLIDKENNQEIVDKSHSSGIFRLIEEEGKHEGTAWVVGRYMNIKNLLNNVKVKDVRLDETISKSITYELSFMNSLLKIKLSLDQNSPTLTYDVQCEWKEFGKVGESVPQLNFFLPLSYSPITFKYDVPFGVIERKGANMDVPAKSFAVGVNQNANNKSVMLVTDSKYGFRCNNNFMSVSLIRSSTDPDPYPEVGSHRFRLGISLVNVISNKDLMDKAYTFNHPLNSFYGTFHKGKLPLSKAFMSLKSKNVVVSGIKMPEKDSFNRLIIRLYEVNGEEENVELSFFWKVKNAYMIDINEKIMPERNDISFINNNVSFKTEPYCLNSLLVEFDN